MALFDELGRARAEAVLICFGGDRAERRFGPAVPRWWNARWLAPIGGGGGTPLRAAIRTCARELDRARRLRPAQQRWLWVLTDGRTNERPPRPAGVDRVVIVDFEASRLRLGRAEALAGAWQGILLGPAEALAGLFGGTGVEERALL